MNKMRIMTVLGTRPEIIRLSRIIPILDEHSNHILVHTGQNYDDRLNRIFFEEMGVRSPDVNLGIRADSFGGQIGQILERCEKLFLQHRPDRLLILGDTNSGLCAVVARRLGLPVYHMEAGNRCYDDRVPEEVNRRVIDHSSTVLMPYTHRSKENLIREGIAGEQVFVTGNPIKQVIDHYQTGIDSSKALEVLGVKPGQYFLVTMHRAENVDVEVRLRNLIDAIGMLHRDYGFPVICSFHPRTRAKVNGFGVDIERAGLRFIEPLGFFDFIRLEKSAFCLLSDSGTVQEEACIFNVPNVTIRDVTERPETVECGSNILSGVDPEKILQQVHLVSDDRRPWLPPEEYVRANVSSTVCRILLSFKLPDPAGLSWIENQSRYKGT
jgi:UDP-N-acetylglucosamine 2-epimerase (non-hydrolysing)